MAIRHPSQNPKPYVATSAKRTHLMEDLRIQEATTALNIAADLRYPLKSTSGIIAIEILAGDVIITHNPISQ